jgi:outer membrane protein OmpA-like peptidoglycan-associated protein
VEVLDVAALSKVLDPRWDRFRPGKPPKESNTHEVVFRGAELGPFDLKGELPNTVVIKPPLGKLFAELWDKTGRVRHANRKYQITGPQAFEGTTDDDGRFLHEEVFPGDYSLNVKLSFFEGDADAVEETAEGALLVLEPPVAEPQLRMLGAAPFSVLARLRLFFNTNKTFLLPTALPSVKKLRRLYLENLPCQLLVVGHADTRGGTAFNDELSLERAKSIIAYLKDDVGAWLSNYDSSDAKRRWGNVEDHLMIRALPDFVDKPKGQTPVKWFQTTRGLQVDGVAGPKTRERLVTEYVQLDGASLEDFVGDIDAVAHGCGENFPLDESGTELDAAAEDEKRDASDRRVELFFFDADFGITPPPPSESSAPGSAEYPKWRERVAQIVELGEDDPDAPALTFIELSDAHFRTNSAVVLPEGESPDDEGGHAALTSVGLIAQALRFNDEHEDRTLLVAGHTDTASDTEFNQKLSEERARVALCLLKGGKQSRDDFAALCNGRHTAADIEQILSWVTRAIPGFDFDSGPVNDAANDKSVREFQRAYNANKSSLNPGPQTADLTPDGRVGPLTWGAIFDCYEFALRDELGEDADGLSALRDKLVFADAEHESLGFSEFFPIEELGVDDFRSQTNRRVELLFFEPGEVPDIAHAAADPETSDLYLPGNYARTPMRGPTTAKRADVTLSLVNADGDGIPEAEFVMTFDDGSKRTGQLGADGTLAVSKLLPGVEYTLEYPDFDDVRSKALAARLRRAIDSSDPPAVLGVVSRPLPMFERIQTAISAFFPGSSDLISEIRAVVKGTDHEGPIEYCLTGFGLGTDPTGEVVAFNEPRGPQDTAAANTNESGTALV